MSPELVPHKPVYMLKYLKPNRPFAELQTDRTATEAERTRNRKMATEIDVALEGNTGVEEAAEKDETKKQAEPHKLERKWTFWYDNQSKPKQGAAWGSSLKKVYTFDTVEEFWW